MYMYFTMKSTPAPPHINRRKKKKEKERPAQHFS